MMIQDRPLIGAVWFKAILTMKGCPMYLCKTASLLLVIALLLPGWSFAEDEESALMLPNPWEDLTQAELADATGITMTPPESATEVLFRLLREEGLCEMQFMLGEDEYCARAQKASLAEGEIMNISGMYYYMEDEKEVVLRDGCRGILGSTKTGSQEWVYLLLWYEPGPEGGEGMARSLSAYTQNPAAPDLLSVAEAL